MRSSFFKYIIAIFLLSFVFVNAQDKYFTRTGHIHFISKTKIIDIAGDNRQVTSIVNIKSGELVFAVLMKSFKFKRALAEEHFNENYIESDKFPKAKFKGKIININEIDLSRDGSYSVEIEGILEVHGRKNKIKVKGTMDVKNNEIFAEASFTILLKDYNIGVPDLVKDKVAEEIPIEVNMKYIPYQ